MIVVPFVCCGDPSFDFSFRLIKAIEPHCDFVELGIAFSDPIADGKTIQAASNRALANGVSVQGSFALAKKLHETGFSKPFVFMTYYNIVFSFGKQNFLQKMKQVGVNNLLVVDLPFGEDKGFEALAKKNGVAIINLLTQKSTDAVIKKIALQKKPFVYLVSAKGVTGARNNVSRESIDFVKRVRRVVGEDCILCVGFGISKKAHAKKFFDAGASGVVVGSQIINIYSKFLDKNAVRDEALSEVEGFVKSLKEVH